MSHWIFASCLASRQNADVEDDAVKKGPCRALKGMDDGVGRKQRR